MKCWHGDCPVIDDVILILKVPTELATSPLPGHDAADLMAKGVRQLKDQVGMLHVHAYMYSSTKDFCVADVDCYCRVFMDGWMGWLLNGWMYGWTGR